MTVSSIIERPGAYFAVYSTWKLSQRAEASVMKSPKRSENSPMPA